MKAVKKKKKSIFLRIALLAFSIYTIVMLIQLQLQISEKKEDIADLEQKIADQQRANEDLQLKNDHYESYLDQEARKQGLSKPGESIYVEIPGD